MTCWLKMKAEPVGDLGPALTVNYPDAGDLAPIVIICAVSILLSVLWLACLWRYSSSRKADS